MKNLNWPTVKDMIQTEMLCKVNKAITDLATDYLACMQTQISTKEERTDAKSRGATVHN